MTDEITKNPLNVPGRYYVLHDVCLDHECCVDDAPLNFRIDENGSAYVFKQPTTPEEEGQCRRALADCPMEAIKDDSERMP
jgi:ferredoxin